MNALFAELTRWNQPIRGGAVVDRWTAWALALRDRHARVSLQGPAAMTTLAPWRVVSLGERWTRFALSLMPRIDVAITAVLQQVSPGLVRHQITRALAPAPHRGSIVSPLATAAPSTLVITAGVSPGQAPLSAAPTSPAAARAPVERVLARLSEAPLAWAGRASAGPQEGQRSRELFDRMVHERRRVEERVQQIIIEERPQSVSWIAEPPVRPGISGGAPSWAAAGTPHGAPAPWGRGGADLDIDQLTEQVVRQIDHRVTALRERLGYPA